LRAIKFAPLFLLLACSPKRYALSHVADAIADTGEGSAVARDDDPELVRDAIPFALLTMESLSDQLDDHVGLRLAMARGFALYAYAFLQQPAELGAPPHEAQAAMSRARRLYLRARDYGVEGLKLARGLTVQDLRTPAGISKLQKEDVPLLYWTLAAWAAAIAANKRDLELIGDLPLIASLLDRALQLDETYDHGALHEFAITFDPSRPEGTTAQRQRQHFERARQLSQGEKISPLVTYAESVSGPGQNKREYEALLKEAAAFDVDQPKARNYRLANVLSQRRARYLLAHEDDVFTD
jgi:predicted anti-sigma-YlaC factor YlaD